MMDPARLRLYAVTDDRFCSFHRFLELVPGLVEAGVTMVQLRHKSLDSLELLSRARALKARLHPLEIPLIVNDRADVAFAARADGVHLGPNDLRPSQARALLGPNAIIGVSVEKADAPLDRVADADYLAASPVFSTPTKPDAAPPLGLDGLRHLCARASLPLVGIGGIGPDEAEAVTRAGAEGVAVISSLLGAPDPVEAARALRSRVDAGVAASRDVVRRANCLTIAGSDSGGGAGIQADLKAMSARGVYAASAITALTAQNTRGVHGIHPIPPGFVGQQIDAVFDDIDFGAVKVGMLASAELVEVVAQRLEHHRPPAVVLDPVMVAKSGDRLLAEDAVAALRDRLVPLATVITPNLPEGADLLGREPPVGREAMAHMAAELRALGCQWVLLKGGHLDGDRESADVLLGPDGEARWLVSERVATRNTHGTGCSLSSAIAAELAKGFDVPTAVERAKSYLTGAITHADMLAVGGGHGPVHHFHELWGVER